MQQKVILMLPAYNEELELPFLLRKIEEVNNVFEMNIHTVVVNDGSTDNTVKVAESFGVEVIDIKKNGGLANAMRVGFTTLVERCSENDIIVTMDADDSHPPGLINRMLTQIREGSDLVIASRYRDGSRVVGLSGFRIFLTSGARMIYTLLHPMKGVRDYTCGFRAYRVSLLKKMFDYYGDKLIEQQGFACMAEILLKTKRFNPVIHELPFILRYDQKQGASKMNVFKTVKESLGLVFSVKKSM